ncbi:MAG: CopD family protein [Gallionellaceae bacterium]|nr:CopD family protein [Gallionellaceae bacterium]
MALFKLLHIFAALVWVGGMFFAYMVLRLSAVEVLQPPERLRLWEKVFERFFNWVWLAVFLLLVSGFYMIYLLGGISHAPQYVKLMMSLGIVMMLIFAYAFFFCYVRFNLLVTAQNWSEAGIVLSILRRLTALNLLLGLLTVTVVVIGQGI